MSRATISFASEPTRLWPGYSPNSEEAAVVAPTAWRPWLNALFPNYVRAGFAARHVLFWDWLWAIRRRVAPRPFVGIWPRGGAKSTSAELGTVALGLRGERKYAIYVRGTQDRADDSVQNIGAMLESTAVQRYYPDHARRLVGKYGDPKGWRRNRLRTAGGFTVDALGLDVASRGVKVEDQRPDLIIFDDVDERHDSPRMTEKKLTTIRETVLPTGTPTTAVIAIQNVIIPHGVFAKLADGSAAFLARRLLSGPEPAVVGLKTERVLDPETDVLRAVITAGKPTWEGQDLTACQQLMDLIGFSAFDRECQHNVHEREGALWTRAVINRTRVDRAPRLKRVVVGVDPSGGGNEIGIVGGGIGYDGHGYVLADRTAKGALGPLHWGKEAAELYKVLEADRLVAEKNFGGDMVESNIKVADASISVKMVSASRGKDVRAEPVASLYGDDEVPGKIHHVGHFPELEAEQTGWVPGDPDSPNRMDALVWVMTELMLGPGPRSLDYSSIPAIKR
jgi:hypothetical protein